jgi:hypothetical protein
VGLLIFGFAVIGALGTASLILEGSRESARGGDVWPRRPQKNRKSPKSEDQFTSCTHFGCGVRLRRLAASGVDDNNLRENWNKTGRKTNNQGMSRRRPGWLRMPQSPNSAEVHRRGTITLVDEHYTRGLRSPGINRFPVHILGRAGKLRVGRPRWGAK